MAAAAAVVCVPPRSALETADLAVAVVRAAEVVAVVRAAEVVAVVRAAEVVADQELYSRLT